MAEYRNFPEGVPNNRTDKQTLDTQIKTLAAMPLLNKLGNGISENLCVLNLNCQIVWCNESFLKFTASSNAQGLYGKRLGEAWNCINAAKCTGGCGTSTSCPFCGSLKSISDAKNDSSGLDQCMVIRQGIFEALEMLVKSTLLEILGEKYIVCAITDISAQTRRDVLEKIYFHDLANETASLQIMCKESSTGNATEELAKIKKMTLKLIDRIGAQRDLTAAEKGELIIQSRPFKLQWLFKELFETYGPFAQSKHINLEMQQPEPDLIMTGDQSILSRTLGNIIKNSIEACEHAQSVKVKYSIDNGKIEFVVHNPSFIPEEHQSHIFQRSFTTKGKGRGLGTYSVRLFVERYLGGIVSFTSLPSEGTNFIIKLPF